MNRSVKVSLAVVSSAMGVANAAPTVRSGAGANAAGIQSIVDTFRADLGGPVNAPNTGPFASGRREINWDAVPTAFADPNPLPANFFNNNSKRGATFSTSSTGFLVSHNAADGAGTVRFGGFNASYPSIFQTFSAEKLFAVNGGTEMDVRFSVPVAPATPATVRGFGAVFCDVDSDASTRVDLFDESDHLVFSQNVSPSNNGLSFLGASFDDGTRIARVHIVSGDGILGTDDGIVGGRLNDVVVMDDFFYSEPIPAPGAAALAGVGAVMAGRRRRR